MNVIRGLVQADSGSVARGGRICTLGLGVSKLLLLFLVTMLIAACASDPGRLLNAGNVDLNPKYPSKTNNERGGPSSPPSGKGSYQYYPPEDASSPKGLATVGKGNITKSEGGYLINVENASIAEVAKLVIGDTLGETYILDQAVQGTITLSTARPLTADEALDAFEAALLMNGAVLVREGNHYKIVPASEVAQGVMGSANFANEKTAPGYGVSIVPLRFISVTSMMELLDSFIAREGTVRASAHGNLILLRGTAPEREPLVDVVLSFDIDWMRKQAASIVTLANSSPVEIVSKLEAIFEADSAASGSNAMKFVPLERLNAVLLIGNSQDKVKRAIVWVGRLDREGAAGMNYYTYAVQSGKAKDLAQILNATFQEGDSGLATSPVSPDQDVFQKGTSDTEGPADTERGTSSSASESGQDQGQGETGEKGDKSAFGDAALPEDEKLDSASTGGKGVRITASPTNNTLVIRATARDYRKILAILRDIDSPGVQVEVNTMIVEVVLNDQLKYGVQAYFKGNDVSGGVFTGNSLVLRPSFPGLNFLLGSTSSSELVLDALSAVTNIRVVSSPSVIVLENQPATIKVGDQIPITTQQSVSTDTSNAPIVNSIEYRDSGVILQVIPRVNAAGLVTMQVAQELSAVQSGAQTLTPTISQRSVTSTVSVYSSQTIVLAGLISGQVSYGKKSVPIVNRVPLIGDLIGSTDSTARRNELVVFITPRVIRDSVDASIISQEIRTKMKHLQ